MTNTTREQPGEVGGDSNLLLSLYQEAVVERAVSPQYKSKGFLTLAARLAGHINGWSCMDYAFFSISVLVTTIYL